VNWKNVVSLIRIDIRSGRLIRGRRLRRYKESKFLQYLLYGGAPIVGLLIGILGGVFYSSVFDAEVKGALYQNFIYLFLSLPTLVMLYSLIFTMMGQIQHVSARSSIQIPYWMPITWKEHTLASTLSNLIGFPLASIIAISCAILSFSAFLGILPLAISVTLTLFASAFLASTTSEIFRVLQVRFIGAIYKSSGKAAVWIRFVGSMLFLIVFYVVWFFVSSGANSIKLIEMVVGTQEAIWYIPYIWLGMALASLISGLMMNTILYSMASIVFIFFLFLLAVRLNTRFGLYEPPAITVSKGVYSPKVSFFEKFGFSPLEIAFIKKDIRAFTRRRELMYLFILPIIVILMPLMQYLGILGQTVSEDVSPFLLAWILLLPGTFMSMSLGTIIIGEEGSSIWLLYSSPISAKNLVKSKYTFTVSLSCLVALLCSIIGILIAHASMTRVIVLLIESILLVFALSAVSVSAGIRGAQFVETPRPRMINPITSLVNIVLCLVFGMVILLPLLPSALSLISLPITLSLQQINLYIAVSASVVIALVIALVFYKIALENARNFLRNLET
jgi:hypothetical protein